MNTHFVELGIYPLKVKFIGYLHFLLGICKIHIELNRTFSLYFLYNINSFN